MNVLTEIETIQYVKDNNCSVARYGDGEYKICIGKSAIAQKADGKLAKKLRKILVSTQPNVFICIPRIYVPRDDWPTPQKAKFWKPFISSPYREMLKDGKTYGSAFITRPDSSGMESMAYFESVKELWRGKRVLLVQGTVKNFSKNRSIFDTAIDVMEITAPDRDAFSEYDNIMERALFFSQPSIYGATVIVLSLGPTATALAYDLAEYGRQALDLGHLGMFYSRTHPKSKGYVNDKN